MWWTSQHALHGRPLQLDDQRIPRASLFPLFDRDGKTAMMMLTSDDPQILLVHWEPGLFVAPLLTAARLHLHRADLHDCELDELDRLRQLWHFDPWWELTDERYACHSAIPTLKSTNLAGFVPSIARVWFDRDLGRVTRVGTRTEDSVKIQRFHRSVLAGAFTARERSRRPPASPPQWRLRPFWQQ